MGPECRGKVSILSRPGLALRETDGEVLQEAGEEEEKLHPGQLFPQANTATCKRGSEKRGEEEDTTSHVND